MYPQSFLNMSEPALNQLLTSTQGVAVALLQGAL